MDDEARILVVDDDPFVLRTMERIMKKIRRDYLLVSSAEDARRAMNKETFVLILCDIVLPGESGMDLLKDVVSEHPDTAIIMITGIEDSETFQEALKLGVYGYIIKPFKISEVIINVSGALQRRKLELGRRTHLKELETIVEDRTKKLKETLNGIVQVVALTVETRDPYTAGHQRRVADLSLSIGKELGLRGERLEGLRIAGLIHDLGKIAVPAEILAKPSRLSPIEFELIKTHSQVGYDILKDVDFPWPIATITLQHHEQMNGLGYPQGLKGEDILLETRILSVADVVEAMANHRPYRPAFKIEDAVEEIRKNRGNRYDPSAVDACVRIVSRKGFAFET